MNVTDIIRKFITISPEVELRLEQVMTRRKFNKGEILRGDKSLEITGYFLNSGAARIFYTLKGKEHTAAFFFENDFIMVSHALLGRVPDSVAIQFIEESDVTFLPHTPVRQIIENSDGKPLNEGYLLFITAMIEQLRIMEERLYVMQTLPARERFQWALSRYPRLQDCATTTQIASFLGVAKETLYRIKGNKYNSTHRKAQAL